MKTINNIPIQIYSLPSGEVQCLFDSPFSNHNEITPTASVIIVTDENVFELHKEKFNVFRTIVIPAGEDTKTQGTADFIIDRLIEWNVSKEDTLLAVGGGVVTDLTGYAASTYKRGMKLQLAPTTLLGMVDAALGGKNGVNAGKYKNMVGTVYQPQKIWFGYDFLTTLPNHEWQSGMAEIIKHACIADIEMFDMLTQLQLDDIRGDYTLLDNLIRRNVNIKMEIVMRDELDKAERHLLNFGHTFGHAIEKLYPMSHGCAISIGMICACKISEEIAGLTDNDTGRIKNLLQYYGLPVSLNANNEALFDILIKDKKRTGDNISFVLLQKIGTAKTTPIPLAYLHMNLNKILQ